MLSNKEVLVLASSSEGRLKLLHSMQIYPDQICHPDIDETPLKDELPKSLALRLAITKAKKVSSGFSDAIIIAADTVSACGRRILPKASSDEDVMNCLKLLSGRRHRVYSAVSVLRIHQGKIEKQISKLTINIIRFKQLDESEIINYILSKEGLNKSGGCNIEGMASGFIKWMKGTVSSIIGLPLYETISLIKSIKHL
ncbi:Septum formation protein Maf [Rickettsiales bacterium Ac37b]|nr:Septum formation protein Maf [Rickettsiales bacterium Ac37b]